MALLWRSVGFAGELHARRMSLPAFRRLRFLSTTSTRTIVPDGASIAESDAVRVKGTALPGTEVMGRSFAPMPSRRRPAQVPKHNGKIVDPETFLKALRRPSLAEAASKFTDWKDLFSKDSAGLAAMGLQPKERKYLLWCMQLFRKCRHPHYFAFAPKGKRKLRGWGPRVQNGVRKPPRRNSN